MITDVRRIQALRQLAERGTVTAAAEALGYTPSAVSQQLAALEGELGTPVTERQGRNLVLTDAGRLLLEHGSDALDALERAHTAVAALRGEPIGPVRVGSLASAAASIVADALCTLLAEHPNVEPQLSVHPLDRNIEELQLGTIDLAVEQSYALAPHSAFDGLEVTDLLTEPLLLLSPADTPCRTVDDAAELPWIASPPSAACRRSTESVAARHGLSPDYCYETDDHFATMRLVGAGLAVAVLPALALLHEPRGIRVAVIPDATRTISAVTRPSAGARPAVAKLIEHLVAAAARFGIDSLVP
ncbi:MAG: LysR family transcriptional regulator [Microthrixaceae bacterium]|nr:LysR family transcriptional regulator [Microthrixaceae bacterium]